MLYADGHVARVVVTWETENWQHSPAALMSCSGCLQIDSLCSFWLSKEGHVLPLCIHHIAILFQHPHPKVYFNRL
jgi:hypothetical protein